MKILIVGDVHWSQYSSIVRSRGHLYSTRLENLIKSVEWAEKLAQDEFCEKIIYLGDFFDRSECNAEELSALSSVWWADIHHMFLCGNHEAQTHSLLYNSANLLTLCPNLDVFTEPTNFMLGEVEFCFLPYIFEDERKPLSEYFHEYRTVKRVIVSHNDIAGYNFGPVVSKTGFDVADIENNCDLFINGHLHNGAKMTNKIINVGNLTGQNFSEDGFKYDHSVIILDTETLKCAVYTNPYAMNFYKIDFCEDSSIDIINRVSEKLRNAVVTIKCKEKDSAYLRKRFCPAYRDTLDRFPYNCNVIEGKVIIQPDKSDVKIECTQDISVDHLEQFKKYILDTYGNSDIINEELIEVCR